MGENVVAYVVKMRERLEEMPTLAQETMRMAQKNQKKWYDLKARERVFEPGQKVLLLLPTSDSKLLTKWHGPYEVTRRFGKVTYELYMPERVEKVSDISCELVKDVPGSTGEGAPSPVCL